MKKKYKIKALKKEVERLKDQISKHDGAFDAVVNRNNDLVFRNLSLQNLLNQSKIEIESKKLKISNLNKALLRKNKSIGLK